MTIHPSITSIAAGALAGSRLYDPVRGCYLRAFKPKAWRQRQGLRAFYRSFVSKNSLVFDIGANQGEHTRAVLALGASVIAVEPLPECAEKLRLIYPRQRVVVVQKAAGAKASTTALHISNISTLGTVSGEWMTRAQASPRFKEATWGRSIDVAVITLDSLIEQHGVPDFIKIDVEGFESEVLDGLATMPAALSFEFNTEYFDGIVACVNKRCFPGDAKFNYTVGEPNGEPALSQWVTSEELISVIRGRFRDVNVQGDIIVRREIRVSSIELLGLSGRTKQTT